MPQPDQYRILNGLSDGVLVIDRDYTIVFANKHILALYGVELDEIVGQKCFTALHDCLVPCKEQSLSGGRCGHRQVFTTGKPLTTQHVHVVPGGEERIFQISISPYFSRAGTFDRVIHVTKDITEQEQLRHKHHLARIEQETIFNSSPYAVSFLDPEMRVCRINPQMEEFVGRTNEEVRGRYCYDVWGKYAEDTARVGREKICDACKVQDTLNDGRSYTYERKVGNRYVEVTANPVKDRRGVVIGALETGKDITERKHAEKQLHLYERIISTSLDLISFIDEKYIYRSVNEAYCRAHDRKRSDIVGKSAEELHGSEIFTAIIKVQLDRSLAGEPVHYEAWFDYPGTGRRYMDITYSPFIDRNRNVTGVVVNCRDITERKKSEDALLVSESKYSYLFNNLNDAAFIIGEDGRFIETNEVAQQRLGYTADEFSRMSPVQINLPEYASDIKKRLKEVWEQGSLFFETVHVGKDGRVVPTEISARRIMLNKQPCILALARDISERKEAEAALTASEYRFRELFNTMSSGVVIYEAIEGGADFLIKDINPAGLKSSRTEKNAIFNKRVTEVFPGIEELGLLAIFQEVYRTGNPAHQPAAFYRDKERALWMENFVCRLPSREIVSVCNDITERKRAEQELLKSKQEWERTFDSFTDIVTLQDPSMRVVKVNRAGCAILGLDHENIVGQQCHELFHGIDIPCPGCPLLETKKDFQPYTQEMYHEKMGKTFLVSAAPVLDGDGELEYIAHVAKDISEFKRLQEELFQAQKMEAVGVLAGGVAHDFNNILSGIIGYAELIRHEVAPDSRVGSDIVEVIGAGKRAADLVKQILTFSRKTEINKRPLRPHLIVKEALKLLRATLPASIDIVEQIDPDCGTVLADSTNIHQIVVNLCTNALHAMSNEKGVLRVVLERREVGAEDLAGVQAASPGTFVVLSVSDTGCGMDKVTVDHIFEPYFTTREVGTGTGLGLAVIHGIVQDAQGFINVTSTPEQGSTFEVYLPVLRENGSEENGIVEDVLPQRGHEHILFVDDEDFLVQVMQRQLEDRGYRVTVTTDSREALEKIRIHPEEFDLLITDQTMPGLTGAELAMAVRTIQPAMPIILCTGHSSVLSREQSKAIGIDRYIFKPIMGNELFDAVREILDEKQC